MTSQSRTALITGASRGLGLALARALAEQGWTLLIDARGTEELETARAELAQKTQVIAIAGDISNASHRQALADAAQSLGGLDVLVNNASILGPSPQPNLLDYPLDVLRDVYEVNTVAPLALLQATRHLLKSGARVINVTSDAGVEAYEGWGGYGSSKAALEQLSHILAAERPDWRVYWVDPGDMRTALHQLAFPGEDISDRPLPEVSIPGLLALLTGDYPSGRYKAREVLPPDPPSSEGAEQVNVTPAQPADTATTDERTIGRIGTQMHQEAFPGEDISDRPLPETSVPGLLTLLTGDLPSGRYQARTLSATAVETNVPGGLPRELRVALRVDDFARAVRFYRDGLGLATVKEWNEPEGHGLILDAGPATLEILDRGDSDYTDQVEVGRVISGPVRLALRVEDVGAASRALQDHGATAAGKPVVTSWGSPSQRLQAPDGMQITLFQPPVETDSPPDDR